MLNIYHFSSTFKSSIWIWSYRIYQTNSNSLAKAFQTLNEDESIMTYGKLFSLGKESSKELAFSVFEIKYQ